MAENDSTPQLPPSEADQPGTVVAPGGAVAQAPIAEPEAAPSAPAQSSIDQSQTLGRYDEQIASPTDTSENITWTASEFIVHHKSSAWYAALGVGGVILALLAWLITRDLVAPAVVIFGAVMLGVYGGRQPRQLQYQLDGRGLTIGQKYYPYDNFRSFSIIDEGAFSSITFMPLKRFAPAVSIYYAPEDEADIVALLSARIPSEERGRDPIDRLMHRIRF